MLAWAGPAQVILISALGGGAPLLEATVAVSLTGVRLLPMVVALLPLLRAERPPAGSTPGLPEIKTGSEPFKK